MAPYLANVTATEPGARMLAYDRAPEQSIAVHVARAYTALELRQPVTAATPPEVLAATATYGDPAAVQRFISADTNINAALALPQAITYQGQLISPIGSLPSGPAATNGQGG